MREQIKSVLPYIIILIVVILIKTFVFTTICVNGISMYPTLHNKDIMIMDKLFYKFDEIERFDVIVVDNNSSKLIKRVIGLPGESVKYNGNVLYIDGAEVNDKYNFIEMKDFEIELNDDEYFVMGDNRGDSLDSRIIGPINKSQVIGRATFTIFPFNRMGGK